MEVSIGGRAYALSETLHSDELAPIFADAWTASRVWYASCFMAEKLVAFAADERPSFDVAGGRSVIELGSGCGLVGLVTAALGGNVLLTDQREAVDLLQRNAQENMHTKEEKERVTVAEYQWGTPPAKANLPRTTYDYILVSDCINPIYGTESWRNLARSIRMLSDDATVTYLAHEARGEDEAMADFQAFSAAFLSFEVVAQQPEKRLMQRSLVMATLTDDSGITNDVGIFWGDEGGQTVRSTLESGVHLPRVRTAVATPQKKTRLQGAISLPELQARQLVLDRDPTQVAPAHESSMSLLVVLQTLWQSIAKDTNAFARQICEGHTPQVADPKLLRQRYYNNSVFKEDRSYFLREREAAFHQEAIHSKTKPSSVIDDKQQYHFDRRHRKAPAKTPGVKTTRRDEKKMVEDRLMDRHDHKMQHLLHVLQSEIANETQREIRGLNYWSPQKKLSRQSKRHVSDIVKERYEAADRIMRILEEYRIVVGVDAARYLQQTIAEGNRIAGRR